MEIMAKKQKKENNSSFQKKGSFTNSSWLIEAGRNRSKVSKMKDLVETTRKGRMLCRESFSRLAFRRQEIEAWLFKEQAKKEKRQPTDRDREKDPKGRGPPSI